MKKLFIFVSLLLTIMSYSQDRKGNQEFPFLDYNLTLDQRVNDLISRLTPEEMVSQMMNSTPGIDRLGIPPYDWWNEALHGVARSGKATCFPQTIGMAATFDNEALYKTFVMISDEARAKYNKAQKEKNYHRYYGLTFWTPNINIFRDPRWGRGQETYGEDPYLTSQMGLAVVKGLQGDNDKYLKTHACAKHFAVHSGPEALRHIFNAEPSARDLWETYLPAFKVLVQEGDVEEVMCAYNSLDGAPCCSSKRLLMKILRDDWGYKHIVTSDCGAINDLWQPTKSHERHLTFKNDAVAASREAILSGTDIECGSSYGALKDGLDKGTVLPEELTPSLKKLFKERMKLGVFDPDSIVPYSSIPYSIVEGPEHVNQALKMSRESMVLLKNDGVLPLSKELKNIAVVGPNANNKKMQKGNYYGAPETIVSILEGIQNKLPETNIIYKEGCDIVADVNDASVIKKIDETVSAVKNSDVIIYVGGITASYEGEESSLKIDGFDKGDRTNIQEPIVQLQLVKKLVATGKPVIYVLCTGSAIALNWEDKNVNAILNAWYPGEQGGNAVADVLFGDYNPAGRLPVTFYKSVDQIPDFTDYNMTGRTYRYFEGKPLYSFGYGLSYSSFKYGKASLSKKSLKLSDLISYQKAYNQAPNGIKKENLANKSCLSISIPVTNKSQIDGDEVIQVYVKYNEDKYGPIKSLKAFKRVNIPAGKKVSTVLNLTASSFETFNDEDQAIGIYPGSYTIYYGSSSNEKDLKTLKLTIK